MEKVDFMDMHVLVATIGTYSHFTYLPTYLICAVSDLILSLGL